MQNAHKGRGIGVLLANLLIGMGRELSDSQVTLLTRSGKELSQLFSGEKRIESYRLDRPNRFNWIADQIMLPGLVRKSGAELFFATDINSYLVPPKNIKVLSMAYDLIPFLFPEVMASQPVTVRFGWKVNFAKLRMSDRIIAISKATKNDLVRVMGVNPDKIEVIYPGINHGLFNVANANNDDRLAGIRRRFGINGRYILYVGDSEWRKNLRRCLEALTDIDPEVKLLLVGGRAATDAKLHGWIDELGLKERVIITGFIPDADLPVLYGSAEVFLFPSLYEGFGLPIAEAMACGCPVITSAVSSMPEVAGDAGVLVDPLSVSEIKNAVSNIISSEQLRNDLTIAGIKQSARFSWETAARDTIGIMQELTG